MSARRNLTVRLFVEQPLGADASVEFDTAQAHYLFNVMRLAEGQSVYLFDGINGEWRAEITERAKRYGHAKVIEQTKPQDSRPDIWLLFAPIKKARLDFIAEKATELGAGMVQPIITRFTQVDRVKTDRMRANAIEAAEQCGGTSMPLIEEPVSLETRLKDWPSDRLLIFCDETLDAKPMLAALAKTKAGPAAILTGPEGGFSEDERALIRSLPNVLPVTLGPRILRADTAVLAALSLWQAAHGDWQQGGDAG